MLALAQPVLESPTLRLAGRRPFARECAPSATFEARRLDHSLAAHREPRVNLTMRRFSIGGLCFNCDSPLLPGETLSLPPESTGNPWPTRVRVRRCDPAAAGYRVTFDFEPLPAA